MPEKLLEDKEIMSRILEALDISKVEFAEKLGYSSHTTIFNIVRGKSAIVELMVNRIMMKFPTVNYMFLTKGEGEPLLITAESQAQANLFNYKTNSEAVTVPPGLEAFAELLKLPKRLTQIEAQQGAIISVLNEIRDLLKK